MPNKITFSAVLLGGTWASPQSGGCRIVRELSGLKLANTTITSAQTVAAGAFIPPGRDHAAPAARNLPAFCPCDSGRSKPAKDSDIKTEVWLPLAGWNGNIAAWAPAALPDALIISLGSAIGRGYAAASTDTGHDASPIDASWALGHPDKITDFGYRAIHEMTVKPKPRSRRLNGEAPKHPTLPVVPTADARD